jgi:hypothetical protein
MVRAEKGRAGYQKRSAAAKSLSVRHFTASEWHIYKDMFIFVI